MSMPAMASPASVVFRNSMFLCGICSLCSVDQQSTFVHLYMQLRLLDQNHDDSTEAAVGELRRDARRNLAARPASYLHYTCCQLQDRV
jgi:hypothetical protein